MQPKFKIGQVIKHLNNPISDMGKIIRMTFEETQGWIYTIALKDWDSEKRQVLDAVMHIPENEAEEIK